jgi:hypothetical protein
MYGLSPDIDLTFLRGLNLIKICVSPVQVQFHFCQQGSTTSDTGISVEMSYRHRHGDEEYEWDPDMPLASVCSVLLLIGASIADFQGDSDGTLLLKFTNGDSLTFYDETTMYEAYHIWHGNDPLIVV